MKLKIGTRGSALALAQAEELRQRLVDTAPAGLQAGLEIEIVVITTAGDRITDRPLADIGGKGLFTKEIEDQLADGRIDMAVHSSKDMPTLLPTGLELSCFLPREDPRDAFLSHKAERLEDLPHGSIIGSASLRRGAQIRRLRPDLQVINFRGNVQTRLKKLENGDVDATLLALSGIRRLGLEAHVRSLLSTENFLPAPGQGAICVETRIGDAMTARFLAGVNDQNTATALACERAFLAELDGSCRTPIAGHASIEENQIHFRGMILTPDGTQMHEKTSHGPISEPQKLGRELALALKQQAGADFFKSW